MAPIALFDGNALVHRAYHAVAPLTTSRGELTNAVFGFTAMLIKTFGDLHPEYGAVAFDRSAPTFRHKEYSDYKANRVRMADDLRPQFNRVREIVRAFGIPIFEIDGYEADDVLGTLACQAVEQGVDVVVVTGDTDALQLVGPRVRVFIPSRGMSEAVLYDEDAVRARYGLEPRQIIDYKALKGDPSDNIKGVPGVGEKTAQKLLQQHGSVEGLIAATAELDAKLRPKIEENLDNLTLGKRLVTIQCDVPVALELEKSRLDNYDRTQAIVLLRELEFRSLIDRLPAQRSAPVVAGPVAMTTTAIPAQQLGMFEAGTDFKARSSPVVNPAADLVVEPLGAYRCARSEEELEELARELESSAGFAFDTETENLGALREQMIGLSVSSKAGTGWYVPIAHREEDQLSLERVVARLGPVFADPSCPKFGHHAKYDVEVLEQHGIRVEGVSFDTMVAAFVLDSSQRSFTLKDLAWNHLGVEMTPIATLIGKGKQHLHMSDVPSSAVANYAAADADLTLRLKERLEPALAQAGLWELFVDVEMPCVPVLARMEQRGVTVDVAYLQTMSNELAQSLAQVQEEIYEAVGHRFNVNSPIQLGSVLFEELKLPRGKRTRTGWSTDAETLEELRGAHPIVDKLFEYRQVSKLKSTYVDALPTMVNPRTHRVHTSYNQIGANTGRLSSSEPNLQNIPIRSELGRKVRRAFVAGEGYVLLAADYSQVELRILAHITRDEALLEAFSSGQDVHRSTASRIFGVGLDQVSADQRRLAKVVNYGIAYGLGAHGLSAQAGIPQGQAAEFIRSYLERYTGIARYIEETKQSARKKGYVETLLGRRIQIPEIVSVNRSISAAAERRAINAPIQGSNADFMKLAMHRVDRVMRDRGFESQLILQVHDELIFEARPSEVAPLGRLAREVMGSAYDLNPPLEVEIKVGHNWCDVE